uniref:OSK domain-containing protein n=1 Tax=Gouania willdenowi TaxID=441366 RepID=A0A8C5HAI0_GOUWI
MENGPHQDVRHKVPLKSYLTLRGLLGKKRENYPWLSAQSVSQPWMTIGNGCWHVPQPPLITHSTPANRFSVQHKVEFPPHQQLPAAPYTSTPHAPSQQASRTKVCTDFPANSAPRPAGNKNSKPKWRPRKRKNANGGTAVESSPNTLIVGSSMIQNIKVEKGKTFCHPEAQVRNIHSRLPDLLNKHPLASFLVIHVGSDDIKSQQSEIFKKDFLELMGTALGSGIQCVVSGPIPSPFFSNVDFSRLRQLHVWLRRYCFYNAIPFVDNFSAFFNTSDVFTRSGQNLNQKGNIILASNVELTLKSWAF